MAKVWHTLVVSYEQVVAEFYNSLIIAMPQNKKYKKYCFYFPKKMASYKNDNWLLRFTDDWNFNVFLKVKNNVGEYETIDEVKLTAQELIFQFEFYR
ncbi:hypothetical protein PT306_02480 [Metamycoplasma hyosynoviae]|uniref:hypothetical protein n=1 Tax=Metamycoplasma hyosynoviae TaxID=29559 RepID=UPI0004618B2C|nr:hypothetical protein [Metamycoplasma hyosynoviae]KDE45239.1 hypothetical protein NPL4_01875 [Metamycoplasma hyosynoviae]MDC8917404.1 hypothetical protein [Metamycoplasma hyosynoviae]MDD1379136.1 hypothetical protein [Metamycoplasma hyosynoviae]MDD7837662.1 hypothetical protein [Metamycoplasma hyosynoviae]MDD7912776.1 hypothetical protein [Metamycoplasma hyosynoviae]